MMKNNDAQSTKSKAKIYIVAYVLIFVALYVYIYIVPRVSDIFVDTYIAEYGTLENAVDTSLLFVRDEKVYEAAGSGAVSRVVSQGKLVRKGAKVVTLGGSACYTKQRGIISYFYDGMEGTLTPDKLDTITISSLDAARSQDFKIQKCKSKNAESGDKLFKVVDNQQWYLIAWLSAEEAEGIAEGGAVSVDFNDENRLRMKVKSIATEKNEETEKQKIVLSCNRYYEFFDKYRAKDCKLIKSSRTGILLETSSIVEEDGQKGVYVKDKFDSYNFTPISILSTDGDVTVVEKNYYYDEDGKTVATVKNYDEILKSKTRSEGE